MAPEVRRAYAVSVVVVGVLLIVASLVAGATYTQHVAEQAEQRQAELRARGDHRWCALLASLNSPSEPPTTERGRVIQAQVRRLLSEFECEAP